MADPLGGASRRTLVRCAASSAVRARRSSTAAASPATPPTAAATPSASAESRRRLAPRRRAPAGLGRVAQPACSRESPPRRRRLRVGARRHRPYPNRGEASIPAARARRSPRLRPSANVADPSAASCCPAPSPSSTARQRRHQLETNTVGAPPRPRQPSSLAPTSAHPRRHRQLGVAALLQAAQHFMAEARSVGEDEPRGAASASSVASPKARSTSTWSGACVGARPGRRRRRQHSPACWARGAAPGLDIAKPARRRFGASERQLHCTIRRPVLRFFQRLRRLPPGRPTTSAEIQPRPAPPSESADPRPTITASAATVLDFKIRPRTAAALPPPPAPATPASTAPSNGIRPRNHHAPETGIDIIIRPRQARSQHRRPACFELQPASPSADVVEGLGSATSRSAAPRHRPPAIRRYRLDPLAEIRGGAQINVYQPPPALQQWQCGAQRGISAPAHRASKCAWLRIATRSRCGAGNIEPACRAGHRSTAATSSSSRFPVSTSPS